MPGTKKIPAKKRRGAAKVGTRRAAASSRSNRGLPPDLAGMYKPIKKPVTLRLDADILAFFKSQGRGYQTRINHALRELVLQGRKRAGKS